MNRTDIKIVMGKFNTNANRLMQAAFDDYIDVLTKFISYIEKTEVIFEYIVKCGGFQDSIADDFKTVQKEFDCYFSLGDDEAEEVSNVYSILKYMSENYDKPPYMVLMAYSNSNSFKDMLKAFNERVSFVLISHISDYLKEIGIKMGLDDNQTFIVNGGQVNIANDNSTINATQNNEALDLEMLTELIEKMRAAIDNEDLSDEDKADAQESIDNIETELKSGKPDEKSVKREFKLLSKISKGVDFTAACCDIATFAMTAIPYLAEIPKLFG